MEDKIKSAIKNSVKSLDDIDDVFEDFFEDLPEHAEKIHKRTRESLKKVKKHLSESLQNADVVADETQLKAHLGLMEAKDQLEASRPVMEDCLEQARDRGYKLMGDAKLQSHLAAMEAEDYWDREGRHHAKKFADSTDEMLKTAADAIDNTRDRLAKWVQTMRDKKSS